MDKNVAECGQIVFLMRDLLRDIRFTFLHYVKTRRHYNPNLRPRRLWFLLSSYVV